MFHNYIDVLTGTRNGHKTFDRDQVKPIVLMDSDARVYRSIFRIDEIPFGDY